MKWREFAMTQTQQQKDADTPEDTPEESTDLVDVVLTYVIEDGGGGGEP